MPLPVGTGVVEFADMLIQTGDYLEHHDISSAKRLRRCSGALLWFPAASPSQRVVPCPCSGNVACVWALLVDKRRHVTACFSLWSSCVCVTTQPINSVGSQSEQPGRWPMSWTEFIYLQHCLEPPCSDTGHRSDETTGPCGQTAVQRLHNAGAHRGPGRVKEFAQA